MALFVIGPVFHEVESYVKVATVWLLSLPMGLGGLILGGVHQVIVVTGVHHIFNLLEANLVTSTGSDPLNAIITAAMTAQLGATLAVGVKTKNPKLKLLPSQLHFLLDLVSLNQLFLVSIFAMVTVYHGLIAGAAGGWLANILGLGRY